MKFRRHILVILLSLITLAPAISAPIAICTPPAITSSPACHSSQFSPAQFAQDPNCPPLCDKEYTQCVKQAQETTGPDGNIDPSLVRLLEQTCMGQRRDCGYCCTNFPQGRPCSTR